MAKIFKTVKEAENYYRNNPSKPGDRTNIFGNKPPKKARRDYEHELQVECVNWFRNTYPDYAKLLWATPNAGKRTARQGAYMKEEGLTKGVPDLFLAKARLSSWETYRIRIQSYFGLFIEMKIKPNKCTESQIQMMDILKEQGYKCEVVYSHEQFQETIEAYLK